MIPSRKIMIGVLVGFALIVSSLAVAQIPGEQSPASPPEIFRAGNLELIPTTANLVLENRHGQTYIRPTIRFRIRSMAQSDVRVILFQQSITATDDLGEELFRRSYINSSGINLSDQRPDRFANAFQEERARFITLSPQQWLEVQVTPREDRRVEDRNQEFVRSHRPRFINFSATLGIINDNNSTELRGFSFPNVPLSVRAR